MLSKLLGILGSKRSRQLSVVSTLAQAVLSFKRGQKKAAALFLGAAALSYKRSELGYIAQIAAKLLKKKA
ncbi:hypothetical protein SAMN04487948_10619 [Halogranum amylolyticum]|uniref:Uncharacterized protein n=1 Tax=Halogranum amylolyticum TaxID=660520 RepID=A0A1H8T4M4_9EURY|nr:hypothetical protein [Halogranum amylolyticum]SEO85970.1 hypothetical protein SAMN04487948_10619 [Halogranum amylolyticum]